jgi:hypothetical protein
MSADNQLLNACNEWRRLAESEGEAIRARNWNLVADCQKALRQFQPLIARFACDAREEWTRLGPIREAKENSLRATIAELIEIETRNNALLDRLRETARAKIGQLEQAGRNLRQIHRFYARSFPASWSSVS